MSPPSSHHARGLAALPGSRVGLLIGLVTIAMASQFFRSSLGVIAPELIRDLALSPPMLGLAGGVFFLALGCAQVPVGMSFDRVGPRRTVLWIGGFAVAGALLLAFAHSGATLVAGRFLLGFGCGASLMSSVVLLMRWFPPDRISTMYGRVFAASQIGNVLAATPMAWASAQVGWRTVFGASAVAIVAIVALFWWAVRDQPPGQPPISARGETLSRTLRGFGEVLRVQGYKKVVAVHMVAYATLATMLGLWAGPYLHDVHGMDGVARGNVLLAMSGAQVVGMLWLVPLERRFNTRKWMIVAGASLVIALLAVLAAVPRPPVAVAVALLVLLCAFSTYSPIIIAHAAALTPPQLLGRGSATANMGQVTGSFLLPVATGAIADAFVAGPQGYPAQAYRWIFAFMAVALATGLAVYATVKDLRPKPAPSA